MLRRVLLRHANPAADAAACAAIYAPGVRDGFASFEEEAPDAAELTRRITAAERTHAWLVAEEDGTVAGFAYAGPHRARAAYRWAADVSVYVAAGHQGQGVGRALYDALLGLLRRQRLLVACAGIALPNDASVRLHEGLGFRPVARYEAIGYKAGAWRDVGWWQLDLAPRGDGPPAEPLGPQRLRSYS
jgi:L-amino acid N-acyltransferase YncA